MSKPVIGLWLNDVPDDILNDDNSLRELSEVILQGYRAQKMVVADNALLITMDHNNRLPHKFIGSVAQDLKNFLIRKKIPQLQMDAITLSSYQDAEKWESIKDQITAAVDERALNWDQKPLEVWSCEDIQQWLTDKELKQYIKSFQENDIDGENLLELNESDLKDLGITSIGHRKLFMRNLADARKITFSADEDVPASDDSFVENKEQSANLPGALTKELSLKNVMVHGLPKSLLQDEDTLFDLENLVFSVYAVDTFEPRDDGILVRFESPLTTAEIDEMKDKVMEVLESLMLDSQVQNGVMIDLCDSNGNIPEADGFRRVDVVKEPELEEMKAPTPPTTINYWKDFYLKLTTNGDVEDFFDDEDSRLNLRGSREVLATIRDIKLKDVKKDDPGIKHLKGLCQSEIQAAFSYCMMEVMHEVEGTKQQAVETFSKQSPSTATDKPGKGIYYVGMSVEGLPQFITDDDNTVHGIQSLVFRDVVVRRLIVLDDQTPPALKVEFENFITSEKIPQLARNLKNFLKAVNVDQKALNDVTIAFLEEDQQTDKLGTGFNPHGRQRPQVGPRHKRLETDDFLVSPGDVVDMTRTFMIEGIPENYLKKDSFLQDMPEKVFEGVPLEGISVPPATTQADGTLSQTSLEIRFKVPQNIQKLPKIAMKLKKFLKRNQIPPTIVNRVTLQVRHDGETPGGPQSELVANPVVGLVFKGIPKDILESNESLYDMESDVFTGKHPIRLMEPNEADLMLRITIEKPIHSQQDLTTIAQRLKRFLAKQGIGQQAINDVLVMSFSQEKWQLEQPKESQAPFNPNDYVGIEIENMPLSIVESDKQLKEIEQRVFSKQKVVHMNVIDTTLRVTFGVAADSKAIEKVARELKRFLSQMKIPTKQINDIIIAPHTEETWDSPK